MSKKKIIGAFLIAMALLVMLLPAAEADAESSASAFTIKGGKLVSYNGTEAIVSVPSTVEVIGEGAFENNTSVEKVILPDSVKEIQAYAFWKCDRLKTVVLGKKLKQIGDFSFMNCTGLETITIPSSVQSIGIKAFAECRSFEEITIPPETTDISEDAFDGDYLLNIQCETGTVADKYAQAFYEKQKNMTVFSDKDSSAGGQEGNSEAVPSDGVYSGADYVAEDKERNPDSYEQPQGNEVGSTKVVGNHAMVFWEQDSLGTYDADQPFTEQTKDATMQDGTGQEQTDVIPERMHYREEALEEAVIPETVRTIGEFAYARSGIRKLELPQGLETISYAAFYHCDGLEQVELPDSITKVEAKAFAHTAWLENFLEGTEETDGEDDFLISGGVLVAYRGTDTRITLPEGVRVIAEDAFEGRNIQILNQTDGLQNYLQENPFGEPAVEQNRGIISSGIIPGWLYWGLAIGFLISGCTICLQKS